jgi:hypothetical protein
LKGDSFLATIEAIYHFFKTFDIVYEGGNGDRYEGLLYYFKEQYKLIQDHYKNDKSKNFTSKKAGDYITYED